MSLQDLDNTSSVGNCALSRFGTTIGVALGHDGIKYDPFRVSFFKECVRHRMNTLLNGEEVADHVNVFVKQEPHKQEKIDEERFRLISGVSVIDTMVDRILFGPMVKMALTKVGLTPCMAGWVPINGGFRFLEALFAGKSVMSLDKRMWDWSVAKWMIDMWRSFIVELANDPPEWWLKLVEMRFLMLFRKTVFRFEDGTCVAQPGWGVMKSGCYLTLILNSVGQSLCHYRVRQRQRKKNLVAKQPRSMGDDTVQEEPDDLEDYLKELKTTGAIPKEAKVTDWIEFAGFVTYRGKCWPAYWKKHVFQIKHLNPEVGPETLEQYQLLYAHEPTMLRLVQANMKHLCPTLILGCGVLKLRFNGVI